MKIKLPTTHIWLKNAFMSKFLESTTLPFDTFSRKVTDNQINKQWQELPFY